KQSASGNPALYEPPPFSNLSGPYPSRNAIHRTRIPCRLLILFLCTLVVMGILTLLFITLLPGVVSDGIRISQPYLLNHEPQVGSDAP
ncbi:hypothetical protein NGA_0368300, partial [Nannochloropsis gaditana CCMP526]